MGTKDTKRIKADPGQPDGQSAAGCPLKPVHKTGSFDQEATGNSPCSASLLAVQSPPAHFGSRRPCQSRPRALNAIAEFGPRASLRAKGCTARAVGWDVVLPRESGAGDAGSGPSTKSRGPSRPHRTDDGPDERAVPMLRRSTSFSGSRHSSPFGQAQSPVVRLAQEMVVALTAVLLLLCWLASQIVKRAPNQQIVVQQGPRHIAPLRRPRVDQRFGARRARASNRPQPRRRTIRQILRPRRPRRSTKARRASRRRPAHRSPPRQPDHRPLTKPIPRPSRRPRASKHRTRLHPTLRCHRHAHRRGIDSLNTQHVLTPTCRMSVLTPKPSRLPLMTLCSYRNGSRARSEKWRRSTAKRDNAKSKSSRRPPTN